MSLIDPATPHGFFHYRIVPYKIQMLKEGLTFFTLGPDEDKDSYFDSPLSTDPADCMQVYSDPFSAKMMVKTLRDKWDAQGETLLHEMTEPLEALRKNIVKQNPEQKQELSDFVYPLF